MTDRRQDAYAVRLEAAELARSRDHAPHKANGDEQRYAGAKYFMSFTKGLPHNPDTGLLEDPRDFVEFRRAIDDGFIDPFTERVRHGAKYEVKRDGSGYKIDKDLCPPDNFRQWEAPTAGIVFDLEGPDSQAVTMPPAPPLMLDAHTVNPELAFEVAEVYELAILRDKPFNAFETGSEDQEIEESFKRLNRLDYIHKYRSNCCEQPGRPRTLNSDRELDFQTVFRGSSPGVEVGPYLSQFLLIGNTDINQDAQGKGGGSIADGKIIYGVVEIDQRVPVATPKLDYMTTLEKYVEVQRGLGQTREKYIPDDAKNCGDSPRATRRFISTPRDLATYVHYDQLYEAYLNACLILLGMGTPFDPGFDQLSGGGVAATNGTTRRNASGFALYGGPHILTLVTEVATRALKAVRYQKFNNHIRLRPEALAARIDLVGRNLSHSVPPSLTCDVGRLKTALESNGPDPENKQAGSTLEEIYNGVGCHTNFLPMAFPEGSPMHPAYGAGHATVAGACVTILKAFFDTGSVLAKSNGRIAFKRYADGDEGIIFRAPDLPDSDQEGTEKSKYVPEQMCLRESCFNPKESCEQQLLTLEGELNKLAANISIGRDMAGVHFFSDYYDSIRMGEEIAIGMLEEQALTYSTDPFVLSVPTFDGDVIRIGNR